MRPLSAFLAAATLALGGCAKFPKTATSDFTQLSFTFRMNAAVDPNYLYFVVIRPQRSTDAIQDADDTYGPIPVITTGSKNGFVEGRPTRFIQYDPAAPQRYYVKQFGFRTPTSDDPNPIDLGAISVRGDVLQGVDPTTSGDPNTLGFTITTQDLGDSDDDARTITAIEFNIITMNRTALSGGDIGSRVMDALGDQRSSTTFNEYQRRIITTSGTYTSSTSTDPEQENDTYNGNLPSIDIVDWSLQVRPQ